MPVKKIIVIGLEMVRTNADIKLDTKFPDSISVLVERPLPNIPFIITTPNAISTIELIAPNNLLVFLFSKIFPIPVTDRVM